MHISTEKWILDTFWALKETKSIFFFLNSISIYDSCGTFTNNWKSESKYYNLRDRKFLKVARLERISEKTHYLNSKSKASRKFVCLLKCMHFQNEDLIRFQAV